jgi:hypothetical protein
MLKNMLAAGTLLAAFSFFAPAQQPRGAVTSTATADGGDFVQDGLKFHKVPGTGQYGGPAVYQIVDLASSNPAGQMMVRADGTKAVTSYPGYDQSKIEAAFNSHANGGTSAAVATASAGKKNSSASANSTAAAPAPGFEAATKTVTLSDGRAVTFIDDKHAEVKMQAPAGTQVYELEYHKGGAGGIFKTWADTGQRKIGGSVGGSGVTISVAAANGMPGGQIYDTARGVNMGSQVERVKLVISTVREAANVASSNGAPKLAQSTVIKSLLSNNLGL